MNKTKDKLTIFKDRILDKKSSRSSVSVARESIGIYTGMNCELLAWSRSENDENLLL